MSMHETLRMSWWNAALTLVALVAAVVKAVQAQWVAAIIMLIVAIVLAAGAVYARSGRSSDFVRLNAAEYVDERDRAMGAFAFTIVGVVALVLSIVVLLIAVALLEPSEPMFWVALGQVVALMVAWSIANVVAVRRS